MHHYPNWSYGAALGGGALTMWGFLELIDFMRRH